MSNTVVGVAVVVAVVIVVAQKIALDNDIFVMYGCATTPTTVNEYKHGYMVLVIGRRVVGPPAQIIIRLDSPSFQPMRTNTERNM